MDFTQKKFAFDTDYEENALCVMRKKINNSNQVLKQLYEKKTNVYVENKPNYMRSPPCFLFIPLMINKKKILEHDLVEQIKLEVKIMYKLNHNHILKLFNHYEDDDNFYLILQYCAKGQIYSLLKKEGRFSDKVAA